MIPSRMKLLFALVALAATELACGDHGLNTPGKDAATSSGRDAATDPAPNRDTLADLSATGDSEQDGGRDGDVGVEQPRDGRSDGPDSVVPDGPIDAASPDRASDSELGIDVASRDAADGVVSDHDGPVDTAEVPALYADARIDLPADLPAAVDSHGTETGFDSSPSLQLVAGGTGGLGTTDGVGADARFCTPTGAASDGQGNLYVADYCNHVIRKVVIATGATTTLAGKQQESGIEDGVGGSARFAAPAGVAYDGHGTLFVTDSGTSLIRKLVIATAEVTTVAGALGQPGSVDGTGTGAVFSGPFGIVYDQSGALYITEIGGHVIRKLVLATGVVTTVAGSAGNSGFRNGTGASALFSSPKGIAVDATGALLVADTSNQAIRKVAPATGAVTTVDKTNLHAPTALASDDGETFYVTDSSDMTLQRLTLATGAVSLVAGERGQGGSDDGTGAAARFMAPAGVALDGTGNALVTDWNNTIRKVVLATGVVTTVSGQAPRPGDRDGSGVQARLRSPAGVVNDGKGHLLVADLGNHTIRKVDIATGAVTTLAGAAGSCDMADGAGADARFCSPAALALDGAGGLYVADSLNHAVRKLDLSTAQVSTVAGYPGVPGSSDGSGSAARFDEPMGIAADGAGTVYLADSNNDTIRKITVASGLVTTLAGTAGQQGGNDGIGAQARFNRPFALALDGAGSLFVGDTDNNTVRRIALATANVTTIAGSADNSGSEDGIGADARFTGVHALSLDGAGSLFVADYHNRSVRKLVLGTGAVTTVVGGPNRLSVILGTLPGSLTGPAGLAFAAPGTLFIIDDAENVVLRADF
jgi:streptogramin lyase